MPFRLSASVDKYQPPDLVYKATGLYLAVPVPNTVDITSLTGLDSWKQHTMVTDLVIGT
jgi:hypothetical protein